MRLRSANRGNANNAWNVNSDGNANNNHAFNAYRSSPIVLHRAPWLLHSNGCPEDVRQGAEIPSERINNTRCDARDFHAEPVSAITWRDKINERIYNRV